MIVIGNLCNVGVQLDIAGVLMKMEMKSLEQVYHHGKVCLNVMNFSGHECPSGLVYFVSVTG